MALRNFFQDLSVYLKPDPLRMLFLGFSSGLPLLLVLGTLSFWLREAGIDLKTIGFLSWVGLIYGFKWVWAPVVDCVPLPILTSIFGRRRSWLLVSQTALIASLCGMAFSDPAVNLSVTAGLALCCAFSSATQDIALDAFRIESAPADRQAALAAMYQTGYRLAMIWAGAGALAVAAWAGGDSGYSADGWKAAYLVMAASVAVGWVTVLLSPEPSRPSVSLGNKAPVGIRFFDYASAPFRNFFERFGRGALLVLALIATYRISDIVMGVMANPFYSDMGFSKEEVAAVSKIFGVAMTLVGAFAGGIVTMRLGVLKTLFIGAVLSAGTNLLVCVLSQVGHSVPFLVLTVSADNLAAGLASAAFVAYLSGLTSSAYSATQYALFSSLMLLLPKFLAGFSGVLVESVGYGTFFLITAAMGIPVAALVWLAACIVHERKIRPETD